MSIGNLAETAKLQGQDIAAVVSEADRAAQLGTAAQLKTANATSTAINTALTVAILGGVAYLATRRN